MSESGRITQEQFDKMDKLLYSVPFSTMEDSFSLPTGLCAMLL